MRNLIYTFFIAFIAYAHPLHVIAQENPLIRKTLNERFEFAKVQPEHIRAFREYTLTQVNRLLDNYFTEPFPELSEKNVLFALDSIYDLFSNSSFLYVFSDVHPDEAIRNLCYSEMTILDSVSESIFQNKSIYSRLMELKNAEESKLLPESHLKMISDQIESCMDNGVHLEGAKKDRFQELSSELINTRMMFTMNSQMLKDTLYATIEMLAGMPNSFIESHKIEDDKYFFTVPGPDYYEILEYANNEEIRKKAYLMKRNFAYDANKDLLNRMLEIRSEKAKLLGYDNFVSFQLKNNMVQNNANLEKFFLSLIPGMKELMEKHYQELVAFNQNREVNHWDVSYLVKEKLIHNSNLDLEDIKNYFPVEKVISGLFKTTEQMFNIEYKKVSDFSSWHDDVRLFEIYSKGELIGNIYLDLYAREGKSAQGASCGPIVPAKKVGTSKQIAQLVLIASFSNSKPSLLSIDNVMTVFHELGHGMNFLFQENELIAQSVGNGEWDFVEIPSTVFEVGVWEKDIVKQITEHVDTYEPLPDSLIQILSKKIKQDQISRAAYLLNGGLWDFKLHSQYNNWTDEDYINILKETWEQIYPYPFPELDKNPLTGEYILGIEVYAGCLYTYIWSLVFAQDVLSVFRTDDFLNPVLWDRYRKEILAPGATNPANESLVNFLGREPNQGAFLKAYGLD